MPNQEETRKFICTNDSYLNLYLNNLFYIKDQLYLRKNIRKIRKIYNDNGYSINVDHYLEPKKFIIIEVSGDNLESYKIPKGFVEVTDLDAFKEENIVNYSIIVNDVALEGTDGVGKSSTISRLLEYGIICQDRLNDVVSNNMLFDIEMKKRALEIEKYLLETNMRILFLINNDKEELLRRINSRGKVEEFDLAAYEYNLLYLDTYNYMLENNMLHNKLDMVDCTNLNPNEQVDKVFKKILHF